MDNCHAAAAIVYVFVADIERSGNAGESWTGFQVPRILCPLWCSSGCPRPAVHGESKIRGVTSGWRLSSALTQMAVPTPAEACREEEAGSCNVLIGYEIFAGQRGRTADVFGERSLRGESVSRHDLYLIEFCVICVSEKKRFHRFSSIGTLETE